MVSFGEETKASKRMHRSARLHVKQREGGSEDILNFTSLLIRQFNYKFHSISQGQQHISWQVRIFQCALTNIARFRLQRKLSHNPVLLKPNLRQQC